MSNIDTDSEIRKEVIKDIDESSNQAWREEGGIIHIPVSTGAFSLPDWDKYCDLNHLRLDEDVKTYIKKFFNSDSENKYDYVVILKSSDSKEINDVNDKATQLNLIHLSVRDLLFIRMKLSDKEIKAMELWWIAILNNPDDDKVLIIDAIGACLIRLIKSTDLKNLTNKRDGFAFGMKSGFEVMMQ